MSEKEKPPNIYELIEQQQKQLDLLAKAVVELSDKQKAQRGQGGGTTDLISLLREIAGGGEKKVDLKSITEAARYWALLADAVDHYRHPSTPYSGADRFLMRAGARSVYRMTYEGVKKEKGEVSHEPTEEEIDRMLGFGTEEKEESKEKEEKEHAT